MIRVQVATAQLIAGTLRLAGPEHHYLMRVRRVRVGEAVELFDGAGGIAAAVIAAMDGEMTTFQVAAVRREGPTSVSSTAHLTAIVPLLKGERMDQCVEKLVEVGCDRLVLWEASRAVVRLAKEKRASRLERIRAQVAAAVRQCGRATIPEVDGVWTLAEVIERTAAESESGLGSRSRSRMRRIALEPASARMIPTAGMPGSAGSGSIPVEGVRSSAALLSGPEGGFSPEELQQLLAAGFETASLTDTVLRAETAPVVAVAIWRWAER
jgi:16S rRNA (uracil1498-N3)-methyltransferase